MLSADAILALALFAFVSSITPGPNNIMLLASGVNFGLRRTVPHMLGIGLGFAFMLVLVGLGFSGLFALFPWLHGTMKIASALYMLVLAWKIAGSAGMGDGASAAPMTFWQAAAFQWINPKAWAISVSGMAAYTRPDAFIVSVLVVAGIFALVNLPSIATWAIFGVALRRLLSNRAVMRGFNIVMALLLVASLAPVAMELVSIKH